MSITETITITHNHPEHCEAKIKLLVEKNDKINVQQQEKKVSTDIQINKPYYEYIDYSRGQLGQGC